MVVITTIEARRTMAQGPVNGTAEGRTFVGHPFTVT